jgi:hypothetical protein
MRIEGEPRGAELLCRSLSRCQRVRVVLEKFRAWPTGRVGEHETRNIRRLA